MDAQQIGQEPPAIYSDAGDPSVNQTMVEVPDGGRELISLTAQADLVDFEMTLSSVQFASTLSDRIVVAELAHAQFSRFGSLTDQLKAFRWPVAESLQPFQEAFDSFADATRPDDWLTAQLRSLLVCGLRTDFIQELSSGLPASLAGLLAPGPVGWRVTDYASRVLVEALDMDSEAAGRLALFGRRLIAEAIGQCQRIAAREAALTELIASIVLPPQEDVENEDMLAVAAISTLLEKLVAGHCDRMARLGLAA